MLLTRPPSRPFAGVSAISIPFFVLAVHICKRLDLANVDAMTFDTYGTLIDWETDSRCCVAAALRPRWYGPCEARR